MNYSFPIDTTPSLDNIEEYNGDISIIPQIAIKDYIDYFNAKFKTRTFSAESKVEVHIVEGEGKTESILAKAKDLKIKYDAIDERKEYECSLRVDQLRGFEKQFGSLNDEDQLEFNECFSYVKYCEGIQIQYGNIAKGVASHFTKLRNNLETNLIVKSQLVDK